MQLGSIVVDISIDEYLSPSYVMLEYRVQSNTGCITYRERVPIGLSVSALEHALYRINSYIVEAVQKATRALEQEQGANVSEIRV